MAPKIWVGAAKNKAFATTSRLRNSHRASPARIESGPAKCGPLRQKYAPAYGVAAPTAPSLSKELDSIVGMNAKGLGHLSIKLAPLFSHPLSGLDPGIAGRSSKHRPWMRVAGQAGTGTARISLTGERAKSIGHCRDARQVLARYRSGHPSMMLQERKRYLYDLRLYLKMRRDTPCHLRNTLPLAGPYVTPRVIGILAPNWLLAVLHWLEPRRTWLEFRRWLGDRLRPRRRLLAFHRWLWGPHPWLRPRTRWTTFRQWLKPRTRFHRLRYRLRLRTRAKAMAVRVASIVGL